MTCEISPFVIAADAASLATTSTEMLPSKVLPPARIFALEPVSEHEVDRQITVAIWKEKLAGTFRALIRFLMMGGPAPRTPWAGGATTVHVRTAGVGSTLPTASVARTWKLWPPTASPE